MKVMPIECKAGTSGKMKSLRLFMRNKHLNDAYRYSLENFALLENQDAKMTMRLGESPLTHCMLSRICANHKIQSLLLGTTSERKKSFYFITLTPSQSAWNALFIGVSVVRVSVRV